MYFLLHSISKVTYFIIFYSETLQNTRGQSANALSTSQLQSLMTEERLSPFCCRTGGDFVFNLFQIHIYLYIKKQLQRSFVVQCIQYINSTTVSFIGIIFRDALIRHCCQISERKMPLSKYPVLIRYLLYLSTLQNHNFPQRNLSH